MLSLEVHAIWLVFPEAPSYPCLHRTSGSFVGHLTVPGSALFLVVKGSTRKPNKPHRELNEKVYQKMASFCKVHGRSTSVDHCLETVGTCEDTEEIVEGKNLATLT